MLQFGNPFWFHENLSSIKKLKEKLILKFSFRYLFIIFLTNNINSIYPSKKLDFFAERWNFTISHIFLLKIGLIPA